MIIQFAISNRTCPIKVNIDKSGINRKAVESFNSEFTRFRPSMIRQNKDLNNNIEEDQQFIKKRVRAMLAFKSYRSANIIFLRVE